MVSREFYYGFGVWGADGRRHHYSEAGADLEERRAFGIRHIQVSAERPFLVKCSTVKRQVR